MKALWHQIKFPGGEPRKHRRPVRRVSDRMRERTREYLRILGPWKARPENKLCRFPECDQLATDNHHKFGKLGPLLCWVPGFVPVCRRHHAWIDQNRAAARALGLLAPVGQWNKIQTV